MRKYLLSIVCITVCLLNLNSQNAYEGKMKINKTEVGGVAIDLDYSINQIKDYLTQDLSKRQIKYSSSKGMIICKTAIIPEISDFRLDYYFQISKRSDKSDNFSKLELAADKGDETFSLLDTDKQAVEGMKNYLNKFVKDMALYVMDKEISDQEALNKKTMDQYTKSSKQLESLQKDKDKLDKEIEAKQKEINQQKLDMDNQKSKLEDLRVKRGSL